MHRTREKLGIRWVGYVIMTGGMSGRVPVQRVIGGAMGNVGLTPRVRPTLPVRRKKAKLTGKLRR